MNRDPNLPCVVILTALPVEYQTVRTHLYNLREEVHPLGTLYESGLFLTQGQLWRVILVETGIGNVRAAVEAERARSYFAPHYIFFVGIAGGLKDVRIGDVVVATKIYGYESGKANTSFQIRPEVEMASYTMVQSARMGARSNDWLRRLPERYPLSDPRVFVAPIVAGEKVISSTHSALWRFLSANYSDALAVEMEGHGFLKAMYTGQYLNALVIRGISDLIDAKKETDAAHSQELAAQHASAFALELLAKFGERRQNQETYAQGRGQEAEREPGQTATRRTSSGRADERENEKETFFREKKQETAKSVYLKRGQTALFDGNYLLAQKHLADAEHLLTNDDPPEEQAQMSYIQALTYLEGNRLADLPQPVLQQVIQLAERSVNLYPTYSYVHTLALLKEAASTLGYASFRQQAEELAHQANFLSWTLKDEENMHLLARCQPYLSHA